LQYPAAAVQPVACSQYPVALPLQLPQLKQLQQFFFFLVADGLLFLISLARHIP